MDLCVCTHAKLMVDCTAFVKQFLHFAKEITSEYTYVEEKYHTNFK